MLKSIPIINPARVAPGKKRGNTMPGKKRGRKKTTNHAGAKTVSNTHKRRGRKRHINPTVHYRVGNKHHTTHVKKGHYRKHRNPDGVPAAYDPTRGYNIMEYAAGAAAGGIAVPVLGTMLQTNLGLTGVTKYLGQIAIAVVVYLVGKKYMPKAALSFLISGVAVSLYQYFKENGIISGTEQLLGMNSSSPNFTQLDMNNFNRMAANLHRARLNGAVPMRPMLRGIVSNNQRAVLDGGMVPMRSAAGNDGSRMSM